MHLLKRRFVPFLVCLLLVAAGCAAWRQVGAAQPLRFSHEKMLHQSVECADCHTETGKGAKAGFPPQDTCMDCHEEIDKKSPPERHVSTFFENGKFKAANVTAIPSEVIFSHKTHTIDHKVTCAECHKGIPESTAITKAVRIDMPDCISCHAKTMGPAKANDCATCHEKLRKDEKPPTHMQNWLRFHGQKAKDGDQTGLNQCSMCHTQDSCNSCHKSKPPTTHTTYWRQRGHGISVSIDRDTCTTCHQSDFCVSCHKTTSPRNHAGQWGEPKDKHCVNCHLPETNTSENCSVCHQQGAPSHSKATKTPASMVGTDCRSCHGVAPAAKMPHVDNGNACNYCHH